MKRKLCLGLGGVRLSSYTVQRVGRYGVQQFRPISSGGINSEVEAMKEELIAWRRDFHKHPELAFEEFRTSGIVAEKLESWGIEVDRVAGTGVVGSLTGSKSTTLQGGSEYTSIGLRADMDALPIKEENDFPHKSLIEGKMHACGHDGHTTMLLGAAKYLASNRESFSGKVNFIFQPAEESQGGGREMVEDGLFSKYPCDEIYALHNWPMIEKGTIAVIDGPVMAAVDEFKVVIEGVGGHAAYPQLTVDPIVIGSHIVTSLQSVISRQSDPVDAAVVSVTQFHAGSSYNVIPSSAIIRGTMRSFKEETRENLKSRLVSIAESTSKAFDATAKVTIYPGYPATVNSSKSAIHAAKVAEELVGESNLLRQEAPSMGAEDFSYMLREVPGCYVWVGSESTNMLHHPKYDFDDAILPRGVQYLANLATSRLQ